MNQNQTISEWETLKEIKQTIFNLEKNNISQSASSIINIMDDNYIFSINLIICKMIYTLSSIRIIDTDIYLNFIKEIEKMEGQKVKQKISEVFAQVAFNETSQESCYLIEKMIEQNLLNPEILHSKNINKSYFIHYMPYQLLNEIYNNGDEEFIENIEQNLKELSKNDWELHKKHIKEGHNPNEIAKIIRNDEIEKLQEISSQTNFNFNQIIYPSLYERCSFINQRKITLIDYAAFFGSIKCFKYLLLNKSKVKKTGKYAIAGGNLEIIHLCKQYHSSFEGGHEIAIKFHRNDIFYYLYENKIVEINELEELGKLCIIYHNYEILSFLQEEGMKITDDIINKSAKVGNIFLVNYFLKSNPIPKTILIYSSESGNIELVKHILVEKKGTIDVNTKNVLKF